MTPAALTGAILLATAVAPALAPVPEPDLFGDLSLSGTVVSIGCIERVKRFPQAWIHYPPMISIRADFLDEMLASVAFVAPSGLSEEEEPAAP